MPLFRKKDRTAAVIEDVELPESLRPVEAEVELPGTTGPFDVADLPELGKRIDLGALRIPVLEGMNLRLEMNQANGQVTGVTVTLGQSSLQVQAFAAPKTWGIWDEIREEIVNGLREQGGTVDDVPGTFGRELVARVPATGAQGQQTQRPARFIGFDGPRWFLRGVLSGKAAIDAEAAADLEGVFRGIVVSRDDEPRPPRQLLPLYVPGTMLPSDVTDNQPDFNPLKQGPTLAEIR